jgi:hypothetical protein
MRVLLQWLKFVSQMDFHWACTTCIHAILKLGCKQENSNSHTWHQSFWINFLSSTSQFFKLKRKQWLVVAITQQPITLCLLFHTASQCHVMSIYKRSELKEKLLGGAELFVQSHWRKRSSTVRNMGKSEWRIRFRIWTWYATLSMVCAFHNRSM